MTEGICPKCKAVYCGWWLLIFDEKNPRCGRCGEKLGITEVKQREKEPKWKKEEN